MQAVKMALRELVQGECGAANPLVQWTSHFSQEKSMLKGGLNHDRLADITSHDRLTEDQLVNEFLGSSHQPAVPQTYNMTALLDQLQMTQQAPPPTQLHPSTHQGDVRVKEWVEEFASPQAPPIAPPITAANDWAREFQEEQQASTEASNWVREFAPTEEERWVEEFESQRQSDERDLAAVAKEMTDTVTDPAIKATEFMDFIKKLSTGEAVFDNQGEVALGGGTNEWVGEFLEGTEQKKGPNGEYWNRLEKEWQDLSKQEDHPWLSEFESTPKYKFQENNPLQGIEQPLEEGLRRLAEGDLPSAVLLFEAEVQARPESVQGWQLLGSTQADNEQDVAAIAALHKCLELDPSNLPAYMSLAVCYTNESQQTKALDSLRNWLLNNPKYSSLVPSGAAAKTTPPFTPSFMTKEDHAEVRDLYLAAAQRSPERVDCDVQVGLGVLFNLSNEYDKAVDCFTAALQVKPDDAMLWNKLGATLANSSMSEKAVEAYRKALELLPGFTRSRYNLGVSCINLGAYKEAVEHFLTALNLQRQAKGPQAEGLNQSQMSESIWSTLRLAVSLSGRPELQSAVHEQNIDSLMREFGIE